MWLTIKGDGSDNWAGNIIKFTDNFFRYLFSIIGAGKQENYRYIIVFSRSGVVNTIKGTLTIYSAHVTARLIMVLRLFTGRRNFVN